MRTALRFERKIVGISAAMRIKRLNYLGASDISAVAGESPWGSAYDVWAARCAPLKEEDQEEVNRQAQLGDYAEPGLVQFAVDELGLTDVRRNQFRVDSSNKILAANCDAICGEGVNVEAKATALWEHWGEPGTNEVPPYVMCQVQQQMGITGARVTVVPVQLPVYGRPTMLIFEVERDDPVIASLKELGLKFWADHIVAGTPPEYCEPNDRTLRRILRLPDSVMDLDPALYHRWQMLSKQRLALVKLEKKAKRAIEVAMSTVTAVEGTEGEVETTFTELGRMSSLGTELTFLERSKTTKGTSKEYADHCDKCGVGSKKSEWRQLGVRELRETQ